MTQGRKLKCLVIHDTKFSEETAAEVLNSQDLELCSIQFKELGIEKHVLRTWRDLRWVLLREATLDTPDLLVIDCNFEDDKTAPALGPEAYDARGLAYGAVMTAYFNGANAQRPFGFAPYSQNMSLASKDQWAITFFGILKAMIGGEDEPGFVEELSAELEAVEGAQKPAMVLPPALEMYRSSLMELADSYLDFDRESVVRAGDAIRAAIGNGTAPDDGLYISWGTFEGDTEDMLIRSLFADLRSKTGDWDHARLHEAQTFLAELLPGADEKIALLTAARQHVEDLFDNVVSTAWQGAGMPKYKAQTLTYAIMAALRVCELNHHQLTSGRPTAALESTEILHLMDLGPNRNRLMNRSLGHVLGNHGTPRQDASYPNSLFFERLTTASVWPYPHRQWLLSSIRKYMRTEFDSWRTSGGQTGRESCDERFWPRSVR